MAGFRYRIEAATVFGAWTELEVGGQPVEVLATGGETAYVVPWPTPLPDGQFFRVKLVAP